jgi:ABC-type transport system substrate-binding protein
MTNLLPLLSRRTFLAGAAAAAASDLALPAGAAAPQVLRVGMTAADLPTVTGIPNNGGEGSRFLGYPVYDALVNWDFTHTNETADITPGLFTSWKIDPANNLRWICTVRQGVKFHDGSDCDADAIMFTLGRIFDEKSPQYDAPAAPIVRASVPMLDTWQKLDDSTIILNTKYPFSSLPYVLTRVMVASPAQWEKSGKSWANFAKSPSGTGPFRITRVVPTEYAEMSRFDGYWDKTRVPKLDRMVVYPMPEVTTRLAALRSGQVDWIEVPPPDAIPSLKAAGFQISLWPYPHTYPYVFNCQPGSPFADVRVRQAMNYALDRDGLCKIINGTGAPAIGLYPQDSPIFGKPKNIYSFDPDRAKSLLAAAGYGPDKPLKAKVMISTAGSGQMVPIPMNEFMQQNFKTIGINIDFDVVEWGTMLVAFRSATDSTASHGDDAVNISLSYTDPSSLFRAFDTSSFAPQGWNWGHYQNKQVDAFLDKAQSTFDRAAQDHLLMQAHELVVDDAPWLFMVHDLNPRALSKKVHNFHPAQSWAQDFTQITMS